MKKLVYIDACIRNDLSRTKKIATPIIEAWKEKYEVETFVLNDMKLDVVLSEEIEKQINSAIEEGLEIVKEF